MKLLLTNIRSICAALGAVLCLTAGAGPMVAPFPGETPCCLPLPEGAQLHSLDSGLQELTVSLRPALALPPNASLYNGLGSFTANDAGRFLGQIFVEAGFAGTVGLFRSESADSLGTLLFALEPGGSVGPDGSGSPGGRQYTLDRFISESDLAALRGGQLWAVYSNDEFPSGASRGQILTVPEPATWGLFVLGLAALACWRSRWR